VTYTDGWVYVGRLESGMRSGDGVLTTPDGQRFDGRWSVDRLIVGEVVMNADNGGVYIGHMSNGCRNGQGKLVNPDGTELSGIWKNDKLVHPDQ
jgi:hypothetical protein